tara:strand:+ start:3779 stop:3976 length:198 start_codon:yes stop_codon:yes gene_type:complete
MKNSTRQSYLEVLTRVQNEAKNQNKDLMTITGFMKTETEILEHILSHTKSGFLSQAANEIFNKTH